jgi:hypothetical protein
MDRPLSRSERVALRIHLVLCTACRRYRRQLSVIRSAVSGLAEYLDEAAQSPGKSLSDDARERIRAALAERG